MSTAKIKKKQISDFDHQVDDINSHTPAPANKRGKLLKTNSTTGNIELVDGSRQVDFAGLAGYITNVDPGFQVEFYINNAGSLQLINLAFTYIEEQRHIHWKSSYNIPLGLAVIKQV